MSIKFDSATMLLLACAASSGLAALPAVTFAATAAAPDVVLASEDLDTVYVTAQRRSERQQDVPISITTLSAEQLTDAGIDNLAGIATVTPALRFDAVGAFAQATIRGVGSSVVTSGAGTNVGIYVDGYYSPSPLAAEFELLNIDNVQVLKGPQGTLFGHNTTGGAILVTTSQPKNETKGVAEASYGSYNSQRYEGYFTTGLTDKISFDVAGLYKKGDGYFHDFVTGRDDDGAYKNWVVRVGLKFQATDDIWFLVRYEHSSTDDASNYLDNAYVLNGVALTPGAPYNAIGVPTVYATKPHELAYAGATSNHQQTNTVQLTSSFNLGFGNLTSYSQYSNLDALADNFNIALTSLDPAPSTYLPLGLLKLPNQGTRTLTQEFLLNSNTSGRFKWTAGAFYLNWMDPFGAQIALGGGPYADTGHSQTTTESAALYFDATYQMFDQWYLSLGGRYTHDEVKDAYFHGFPGVPNTDLPTLSDNKVTPRAVLRYTPTADSSAYFSFSRGYKSAIYNVGGAQSTPVDPESINAYEVGYKYASHGLSASVASYYYDYKNLQVASYTVIPPSSPGEPPTPASVVNNAASSRIYGFEGQVQYDITSNFKVNAGAAYTDAKYKEFIGSPTFTQCLDPVTCGAAGYGIFLSGSTDLHNADMLRAPKVTANVGASYTVGLAGGQLGLSGNLYYTSKFYFDSSDTYFQNPYTLLGLRAEWTNPSNRYTVALYGDNVTGTNYRTEMQYTNFGIGNVWGPPAMFGGEIKVRF